MLEKVTMLRTLENAKALQKTLIFVAILLQKFVSTLASQADHVPSLEFSFDFDAFVTSMESTKNITDSCQSHLEAYSMARGPLRGKDWANKSKSFE